MLSQPLDQKLLDFDEEKKNYCEKYDVTIMVESHDSRTSEGQQLVCELRGEIMQLKASALPPNLRDLEAQIGNQRTEIQSLQRDLQTTQDSLDSWDEVNLNSVQGVHVDDSVGTSTSSVSRRTEPAITHLPQAERDPELFLQRENAMPKAASKLAAALRVHHKRESRTLQYDIFTNWKHRSCSDSP